jgi:hypothetical protein
MAVAEDGTLIYQRSAMAMILLQKNTLTTKVLADRLGISVRDAQRLIKGFKAGGIIFDESLKRGMHHLNSDYPLYETRLEVIEESPKNNRTSFMVYDPNICYNWLGQKCRQKIVLTNYGKQVFASLFGEKAEETENMLKKAL